VLVTELRDQRSNLRVARARVVENANPVGLDNEGMQVIKYTPSASTKSGPSHVSSATSSGVASAKKSTGKGITNSTTRVTPTLPTFQVIFPKLSPTIAMFEG
jgi:hypothetical protein